MTSVWGVVTLTKSTSTLRAPVTFMEVFAMVAETSVVFPTAELNLAKAKSNWVDVKTLPSKVTLLLSARRSGVEGRLR